MPSFHFRRPNLIWADTTLISGGTIDSFTTIYLRCQWYWVLNGDPGSAFESGTTGSAAIDTGYDSSIRSLKFDIGNKPLEATGGADISGTIGYSGANVTSDSEGGIWYCRSIE